MVDVYCMDVTPGGKSNYICSYLVDSEKYIFIVETGPSSSTEKLLGGLKELGYSIKDIDFIVVTHIHLDHGGGAGDLVSLNKDLLVYVHPRGYPHLHDPNKLWAVSSDTLGGIADLYGPPKPIPYANLREAGDGELIDLGDDYLEFMHTPGHASHHMVILIRDSGLMFTGDAAGINDSGYIIPITPTPHNPEKAINSLRRMISRRPRKICFTHFGIYDGVNYLEKALNKWIWWRDFLYELYINGIDVVEAYRRVIEYDPDFKHMESYYRRLGFGGEEILLGIKGMYNYFKWVGSRE